MIDVTAGTIVAASGCPAADVAGASLAIGVAELHAPSSTHASNATMGLRVL